jgi:hypothetical protein
MKLETKFSIGDYVYIIHKHGQNKHVPCKTCGGKGGITFEGNRFECVNCYGNGGKDEWIPEKWQVTHKKTKVGNVRVEMYDEKYYTENPEKREKQISYMVSSTGIGSGSIWYEKEIFKTLKEAEAECKKRNLLL